MPSKRRRLRKRRRLPDPEDDWECPYENCRMRCPTEWAHCRRYAFLRYKYAAPVKEEEEVDEDDDGGEPDVQHYVGVYVDANGEVVPVSLADALRAVAEEGV